MKVINNILRNMTLQAKIVICQIIISTIVLALIIMILQINQMILQKIFLESSMRMTSKQELSQLNHIVYLKSRLEFTFQNTISSLDQLNQMQNVTELANFYDQDPQKCLNEDLDIDSYARVNTICYGIYNQTKNSTNQQQIQQIKNSISLMTQFYQLTCLKDSQLAVVHKSELQFIALVQFVKLPLKFIPQKLSWYLLHIQNISPKSKDIYMYGPPLRSGMGDIKIRITSHLTSKDSNFEGVISREIDMSSVFNMAKDVSLYLYNLNGDVIFGKEYQAINSSFLFNLYNESVTGFNYDDWLQIKNYSIGQAFESNCSNFNKDLNILCRYNSLYKGETYIQVQQIQNAPYSVILYQNNTEFINLERQVMGAIEKNFNSVQQIFIITTVIFAIVFVLCSGIGIMVVLKQTTTAIRVMQFSTQNLQKQIFSKFLLYNLKTFLVKSEIGTRFSEAIRKLIIQTKSKKKSQKCLEIENQKYQKISREQVLFSQYIKKLYVKKISNYYNHKKSTSKQIILTSFDQLYRSIRKSQNA